MINTRSKNQGIACHPKAPTLAPSHWTTVAWNASWIAADAVMDATPKKGDVFIDIKMKTGREVRRATVQ